MASLIARLRGAVAPALVLALLPRTASAQTYDCNSNDPSKWPPSSKPYFMLAIDTSGSMTSCTDTAHAGSDTCGSGAVNNSCGLEPTRINDAKCAVRKTIQAFAGQVNFGMMTYARVLRGCNAGVAPDGCSAANADNCGGDHYAGAPSNCQLDNYTNQVGNNGCGNQPDCAAANASIFDGTVVNGSSTPPIIGGGTISMTGGGSVSGDNWINGGNVVVDMLQDPTWAPATSPNTNAGLLLEWVDGRTDNSREIWADGFTPLEGILRTAHQYYAGGWSGPATGTTTGWADGNYCATGGPTINHPSPINAAQDRPCRSLNIILVTDGQEFCNGNPVNAAQALYKVGTVIQGVRVPIRTFVIGFAGVAAADVDPIADMGDDGIAQGATGAKAETAANEDQLAQALSRIISGSVAPESCNNVDDNCNSCVDEGFKKYCNRNKTGRTVAYLQNAANNPGADDCCNGARATCLQNFANSITPANPKGNQYWLPCWDAVAGPPETNWLCSDPGESCDNVDNNCESSIGLSGMPALSTNAADEGYTKCPSCPVAETCNNLDDNCDGFIDNAPNSTVPYSVTATCVQCTPTPEICDGCDNDCDGDVDEGAPGASCGVSDPPSCLGTKPCVAKTAPGGYLQSIGKKVGECAPPAAYGACSATGTAETCNGIDDNCDGIIDNNPSGTGGVCRPTPTSPIIGTCKQGNFVCQNGGLVCVGYVGPTTEICDGLDNDCDGLTDAADPDIVGMGGVCGSTIGRCTKGTYACVNGAATCQGGQQPTPEVCNGLDDDCNGLTDDDPTDPPPNTGCWTGTTTPCALTCGYAGKTWCPPTGATCTGIGTLQGACHAGTLVCQGTNKWVCQDDQGPVTEECNGLDDDCDGTADEDPLAKPIGDVCGQTVPNSPCKAGVWKCVNGGRVCDGQVEGTAEICNNYDDNCDGLIDNGLGLGDACTPPYSTADYPGDRSKGQCRLGVLKCGDICEGGQGPSPEVCDGVDNDCDGDIDELGPPKDGIDGTADPTDPTKVIGAVCGADAGVCETGTYKCQSGRVVCDGGVTATTGETCDCKDNNCNGQIDEDPPGKPPVCAGTAQCVNVGPGDCRCVEKCRNGEFPCPGGQICDTSLSRSGQPDVKVGGVCIPTVNNCGDCTKKTVKDANGNVLCAPAGTQSSSSRPIPVCECKSGECREPCSGVSCPTGQACSPIDVKCHDASNCFFQGCPQGQTCAGDGKCGANPCEPNPCSGNTPVCRPHPDLSDYTCVGSCAGVTCSAPGESCADGECTPNGCGQTCPTGQVCSPGVGDSGTGTCGASKCASPRCADGSYCEPSTGRCIADPCGGVVCPAGQACQNGECDIPPTPMGTGGTSGAGGTASPDSGPLGAGGNGTAGTAPKSKSAFGLATGGGGCACSVPTQRSDRAGLLAGLGIALALGVRRRRRNEAGRAEGGVR